MAYVRHVDDPPPKLIFDVYANADDETEALPNDQYYVLQWATDPSLFSSQMGRTESNFYPLSLQGNARRTAARTVIEMLPPEQWETFTSDDSLHRLYYRFGSGDVPNPDDLTWNWMDVEYYRINRDPHAEIGDRQTVPLADDTVENDVVLDASSSWDHDPDVTLSYEWNLVDVPPIDIDDQAQMDLVESVETTVAGSSDEELVPFQEGTTIPDGARGTYRFELLVENDLEPSFYDTVGRDRATVDVVLGSPSGDEDIRVLSPSTRDPAIVERPKDGDIEIEYVIDEEYYDDLEDVHQYFVLQCEIQDQDDTVVFSDLSRGIPARTGSFSWSFFDENGITAESGRYDIELEIVPKASVSTGDELAEYDNTTSAPNAIQLDQLEFWANLASFRPPPYAQTMVQAPAVNGSIQRIEDSPHDRVNIDYFSIHIETLPTLPDGSSSPEAFLSHLRLNFNTFLDDDLGSFYPYENDDYPGFAAGNLDTWESDNALSAVLSIDLPNPLIDSIVNYFVDVDFIPPRAAVLCGLHEPTRWRFSAITTEEDGGHPISGNRQWRIRANDDGTYTVYTKGVDRLSNWPVDFDIVNTVTDSMTFEGGEQLWQSLQVNVATYVNENGGNASIEEPIAKRIPWQRMEDGYYNPQGLWVTQ